MIMAGLTRSYYHEPRRSPFLGRSLGQQFYHIVEQNPNKEMYVFYADKERKTFMQMKQESQNLAASLLSLGLKSGDMLAVWGGNHYEWLVTYLACIQLGIVVIHIRMQFQLSMQKEILKKMGCKAILLTRTPDNLYDDVCKIIPELLTSSPDNLQCQGIPDLKIVIIGGDQHRDKRGVYYIDDLVLEGSTSAESKEAVSEICQRVDFDSPACINFTSGSTGFPKAVVQSNHSLLNIIYTDGLYRGEVEGYVQAWETKFALVMNLGGVAAQFGVLFPVCRGNTTVVVAPDYDKEMLLNALHDERCTECLILIHHLADMVNHPKLDEFDLSNLHILYVGGSIIPLPLRRQAEKIAKTCLTVYGSTETWANVLQHPADTAENIQGAAYRALGGTELKIVNENGETVPVSTQGELHSRGYSNFMFYWADEEKTKATKDANGWYNTGDIAIMDKQGFVRIIGRTSDFIIIEGINVSPHNLDKVLLEHTHIANAMVIGVPDQRTGEAVCACIVLKSEMNLFADEVKLFCEDKVQSNLIPKHVIFMADFPTTATGKFHRKKLAESAREILDMESDVFHPS